MSAFMSLMTEITEKGLLPDRITRVGIRKLLNQRLQSLPTGNGDELVAYQRQLIDAMAGSPIALCTREANEQHYELPPTYFDLVLGEHKKYSSCYWADNCDSLANAEADALRITCERAGLEDGQTILELGCGWGSLSLWMAAQYPKSTIVSVSNSTSQKSWIDVQASAQGLGNLSVMTADMNSFDCHGGFDRIVSVEMFEHMRNWQALFAKVASWLGADGRFFMHVFCHRRAPYFFEQDGDNDWMSRYFFSGGLMPSYDLPLSFQTKLVLENRWRWNGNHYGDTLKAWLDRHDQYREEILRIFADVYGDEAQRWYVRWRLFYLACEELFRYNGGEEWFVGHYLFSKGGNRHGTGGGRHG
ncbi:MAG: cyclopropane-fatty-acyl-phospholipid synthase family protein [Porticoccaceae bacterium]|nr:cyclopropane-fatty-acyl-phospholipid synthase family protein [Porticoccaceae bacterium]